MLLYDSAVSGNCYKVRLLLTMQGIEFERREVDVVDRSGRLELLGALNPALRVPTLVLDDGEPLAESNAILCYLAEGTPLLPEDAPASAPASFSGCSSSSTATSRTSRSCASGSASRPTRPAEAEIEERRRGGYAALDAMERHLGGALVPGRRALLDRRHRPLRLHPRRA